MLRFKHILVTLCAIILYTLPSQGQPRDSKRFAAIENEKVAYITKELNLSQSEAQRFFPLYNQYNKEMWALKSAKTGNSTSAPRGVNSFNGSGSRDVLSYDAKELNIKKEFRKKFAEVIGNSRASQFFVIEQNFRELLYKELQRRNR
ncbi:hypothetical protein BC792_106102 [Sphingobacterium allocomposti]|uniref:Uncharacterized protein n=1 Tax=Sphingobacterium allocomposti TaxID=415956 RepID=A0A5S5DKA5_9SPHI|nr:hypothetical protein [Sphingobacterium composti Yoo et al. 2007 non Ten et al. 2007]TYP96393.1 hypothetical protein BC792_106102 [Sphingobacterium composti Yoo et al. 2007 non Ten et al. 2007]HLS95757.1 hypothetical protein [Sphingobacterium sp.]